MSGGEIWLSDAVRALRGLAVADGGTAHAVLAALGLSDLEPPQPVPPTDDPPRAPEPDRASPRRPAARPATPPTPELTAAEPVVAPEVLAELTPLPDVHQMPDPWIGLIPLEATPPPLVLAAPAPLLPPLTARGVLAAAVATPRPGRQLDVAAALRTLARGEVLRAVPRRPVPTTRRGVQVLVDHGDGLEPFRSDVEQLVALLRDVVGATAVRVVPFTDRPDHRADGPPLETGMPVLAVSDLGVAEQGAWTAHDLAASWTDLAARLRAEGTPLVVLVPYAPHRWPTRLRGTLGMLTWDVTATVRDAMEARAVRSPARPTPAAAPWVERDDPLAGVVVRRSAAVELAELLSAAVRVDPALLRRVRLDRRMSVDAEADLWFSTLLRAAGPDGFSFSLAVVPALRAGLARRWADPATRDAARRARAVMRAAHARRSPPVRLEEEVAWHVIAGESTAVEVALAPAVAALAGPDGPSLRFWARQAAARLPAPARHTVSGWVLGQYGDDPGPTTVPDRLFDLPLEAALRTLPTEPLTVRHTGSVVRLGGEGSSVVPVPRTRPRLVELTWAGGRARLAVPVGQEVAVPVGAGSVVVRTAAGRRFVVEPRQTGDPVAACAAVEPGSSSVPRTGFFVTPDLVVTAREGGGVVRSIRYRGEHVDVSVVVRTPEVEVLRLTIPRQQAQTLDVDAAVAPLVIDEEWTGAAIAQDEIVALAGVIESISARDDRFAVLVTSPTTATDDEYVGAPVVVGGQLRGMVLGYQSAYAVGIAPLLDALRRVPARARLAVDLRRSTAGAPVPDLDPAALGGTAWLIDVRDGRRVLVGRIRYLGATSGTSSPVEPLPDIDVTDLLDRWPPDPAPLLSSGVRTLRDDEVRELDRRTAWATASDAPRRQATARDVEPLVDLQSTIAAQVGALRKVDPELEGVVAATLGPTVAAIATTDPERVLRWAGAAPWRSWQDLCVPFGLPPLDATFVGVAGAVLGLAAAEWPEEHDPIRPGRAHEVSVRCGPEVLAALPGLGITARLDESPSSAATGSDVYRLGGSPGAFRRAFSWAMAAPDDLRVPLALGATTRAEPTPAEQRVAFAIALVIRLLPVNEAWYRVPDLLTGLDWRGWCAALRRAGAHGFGEPLDLFGFVERFQDLLAAALDAAARVQPGAVRSDSTLPRATTQWMAGAGAPAAPIESTDGGRLEMPLSRFAQLFRWASPQLAASLRAECEDLDARGERHRPRTVVAFRALRPTVLDPSALFDSIDAALDDHGVDTRDLIVVFDDDETSLVVAELARQRGMRPVILRSGGTPPKATSRRWRDLEGSGARVHTHALSSAMSEDGRDAWLLGHAAAYGAPVSAWATTSDAAAEDEATSTGNVVFADPATVRFRDAVDRRGLRLQVIDDRLTPDSIPAPGAAAWSPDGTRVLVGQASGVTMWDARSGRLLRRFAGSVARVAAWSPDGARLLTADRRGAQIWDATSGTPLTRLDGPGGAALSAAWAPDGRLLATGDAHGVQVWDGDTGVLVARSGRIGHVRTLSWSPDSTELVIVDAVGVEIRGADLAVPRDQFGMGQAVRALAWSPDGSRIAAAGSMGVWLRDPIGEDRVGWLIDEELTVKALAWSPDGTRLATAGLQAVYVWDADTRRLVLRYRQAGTHGLAWSPDGTRLLTVSRLDIRVWDTTTGKKIIELSSS